MLIYTSQGCEKDLRTMADLGMGCLIGSFSQAPPNKHLVDLRLPVALDNGAFGAWTRGYPFPEYAFLKTLDACFRLKLDLNFVVTPDIVAGGLESLQMSLSWVPRLRPLTLALAVQDGMQIGDVEPILDPFQWVFVGGSTMWKWATVEAWINFAHEHGRKCHIGRCGQLDQMMWAMALGADSVDSSSIVRNGSWHVIAEYWANREGSHGQLTLFDAERLEKNRPFMKVIIGKEDTEGKEKVS